VFSLTNASDRAEYEEIMQSIEDSDGKYELADDTKSNWDKMGNFNVAIQYFDLQ
jgi:hypothetical protein